VITVNHGNICSIIAKTSEAKQLSCYIVSYSEAVRFPV